MSCRARLSPLLVLPGLVLFAAGCGVTDYEKKMIDAQTRMERFEEESRVLGPPLDIPKHLDKFEIKRPWANLFIRPQKGIGNRPVQTDAEQPEPVVRGGLLYDYLPPRKTTAGGVTRVELAFGDQKPEDFRAAVLAAFTPTSKPESKLRSFVVPGRPTASNFETIEFEGADQGIDYFYSLNLTSTKDLRIAVVYWVLKAQRGATSQAIEMSLKSFALDAEANQAREQYARGSPLLVPQHPQ